MTTTVSSKDARDNFTDILGKVYYSNDAIIIEKKGRPFGVVISPADYIRYKKAAKERFFEIASSVQEKNKNVDPDHALDAVNETVEEVRADRNGTSS